MPQRDFLPGCPFGKQTGVKPAVRERWCALHFAFYLAAGWTGNASNLDRSGMGSIDQVLCEFV